MLVVPNQGEALLLNAAIGQALATAWTLRLFTNNHIPAASDTEANYTEAAGGGYAGVAVTAATWVTTPGAPTSTAYPEQTFTFTGALTGNPAIYGYYVTQQDGQLVFAERASRTMTPAQNGDEYRVTLVVTLGSVASD